MAVNLSPVGGVAGQFFDNNGDPLVGGKLYTYAAGTTTPQATYTSSSGATANSNPIILNAGGRVPAEIWLTDGLIYKFVLYSSTDQLIGSWDNIVGINSNFVNFVTSEEVQTATAGQTVFTLTTMTYQPGINNLVVYVDGVNQVEGGSYSFVETNSTTVTFTSGLHLGAVVKFVSAETVTTIGSNAAVVAYEPAGSGAVTTTVQAKLRETVSVKDFGVSESNTASQNYDILQNIIRNAGGQRKLIYWPNGTYQLDVFNPNNCVIIGDDVTLQFTYNPAKSTTMVQLTNTEIKGFTFESLEADLSFQYTTADNSTIEDCKFIGWRNPTGSNAWGLHLSFGQDNVRVINCGFQNNTQSDIAIVDSVTNVLIQNCYAIDPSGDPLHINFEPNASNEYNNVLIECCSIGQLDLREDGTGGTSSKAVTVNNCTIDLLVYDGAFAVFNSCRIASIGSETIRYGGQVRFNNSLGLGPNLIADPYLMVNAFNQAQALSNNQIWYIRSRGGAVTAGGRVNNNVNGFRYFSLNESAELGVISYSLATDITITAGKTYCVALTARRIRGTAANHLIILDGGTSINTRSQRQSNLDNNEFTTELFFFTAVNTALNFIVQNDANNSTAGVDIKSISVHEVIFDGYSFDDMIFRVHHQNGVREVVLPALPASNPAGQTGLQVGDRVTVLGGKTYAWDGSALQALW